MDLPLRSGICTFPGRYFVAGSSRAASPRFTISANSSEVKTLETDPISKIVSPSSVPGLPIREVATGKVAIGDDSAAITFDDTHDNADRLLLFINPSYEDLADFVGANNWKWHH